MFSTLLRDDRANIAALGAAIIAIMLAMGAFAVELGNAYLVKAENQRIADLTAIAASLVYNSDSSSTTLTNTVANFSQLNGAPSGAASASVVTSPSGSGDKAILVTVTTAVPLRLARAVGLGSSMNVSASAWSDISITSTSCMIGLYSGGNSILMDGGAALTASNCAIGAVKNISLTSGTITASAVYAGGTISNTGSITTTPTTGQIFQNYSGIQDPIASNSAVSSAFTSLSSLSGTVSNPTTPGGSVVTVSSNMTLAAGNYSSITVNGGVTATITASGNYTVANGIYNGGSSLTITGGNWSINKGTGSYGLSTGGGNTTKFTGAGTFVIAGGISLGGSSTLSFGNGNFSVNGGIVTGGSSILTIGGGSGNSINIQGALTCGSDTGVAACLSGTVNWNSAGSATTNFYGGLTTGSSGSNGITFGNGNININGKLDVTSGPVYVGNSEILVNGNVNVNSGGSLCGTPSPCGSGTSTISVINNGTVVFYGGSTVNLSAPATGATYGIPGIAFASNYTSAVGTYAMNFAGGASTKLSGVMYFPNASAELTGGAATGGANCFEIVANVIYMSGGSTTTSTCPQFNAGIGTPKIKLVQ